ncbi:MAG: hypothetical protein ACI39C_14970 [Dietzia sp.]
MVITDPTSGRPLMLPLGRHGVREGALAAATDEAPARADAAAAREDAIPAREDAIPAREA